MAFMLAFLIVTVSCIAITYKIMAGYSGFPVAMRLIVLLLLTVAWFGPFILRFIKNQGFIASSIYPLLSKVSYFFMGFAFIVMMLLVLREVVWYIVYFIARKPSLSPDNVALLNKLNIGVLVLGFVISLYSVWEANKTPAVRTLKIEDPRITENTKLVVASDFHIDQATPMFQIRQIIDLINAQNPDYVLLVGDIVDGTPEELGSKIDELKNLKAKRVYVSLGNHEFYHGHAKWMIKFTKMGFEVLHNTGTAIGETGIFLGGVPDANSAKVNLNFAAYGSKPDQYKILLSHAPTVAESLAAGEFDLQLSGHTHGGQIFPFHYFAKQSNNNHLAGKYTVNGNTLFITRGAGYWGPPMRLFAPSDITVVELSGKNND